MRHAALSESPVEEPKSPYRAATVKPPASRTAAVISVAVQKRLGTTSDTVRTVPSGYRAVMLTCSRATWVTGSIRSRSPPQLTSATTPPDSVTQVLVVRGSGDR
jgi:hypothetical protein